jgi:hypothetical protein
MQFPRDDTVVVTLDVAGLHADLGVVDSLAKLKLKARRGGHDVRFRNASPELRELLCLCGLREVLLDGGRQTEEREDALGVEERHLPLDPPI